MEKLRNMRSDEQVRAFLCDCTLAWFNGPSSNRSKLRNWYSAATAGTIKSHVKSILSKLNIVNRTEAVIVVLKRGLSSLPWLIDKTNSPHPLTPSPLVGEGEQEWIKKL
jgi:hypothetical protein